MSKRSRFVPLKAHRGIRKDTLTGRYVARKCIDGKSYSETFSKISDASKWRRNFHPLIKKVEIEAGNANDFRSVTSSQARPNGADDRFRLKDVWELYQKYYFPTLERQSIAYIERFARSFYPELMPLKMQEITAEVIDTFMERKVRQAKKFPKPNEAQL